MYFFIYRVVLIVLYFYSVLIFVWKDNFCSMLQYVPSALSNVLYIKHIWRITIIWKLYIYLFNEVHGFVLRICKVWVINVFTPLSICLIAIVVSKARGQDTNHRFTLLAVSIFHYPLPSNSFHYSVDAFHF